MAAAPGIRLLQYSVTPSSTTVSAFARQAGLPHPKISARGQSVNSRIKPLGILLREAAVSAMYISKDAVIKPLF